MTEQTLFAVLVAESALVLACILALVGWVAGHRVRGRRHAAGVRAAKDALRTVVLAEASPEAGADALRALPKDLAIAVLHERARTVSGEALARLQQAAAGADITTHARRLTQDRRWWRRLRGVRLLTELQPDAQIPATLLDDAHPAVRAAAAAAVSGEGSPSAPARLLVMLDDPDPLCRFTAKTALIRAGSSAAAPIRAYLQEGRVPPARPVEALEVAAVLSDPSFVEPALRLSAARNPRTRRAATALLARAAGEAATVRIMELLEDSDARVRAQAARGLGDLRHWPAAPALCRTTGDPAWEVRSAAAIALRRIGAPGRIYLREALRSDDPFSADIARQVLSLPESAMTLVVS